MRCSLFLVHLIALSSSHPHGKDTTNDSKDALVTLVWAFIGELCFMVEDQCVYASSIAS